MASCRGSIGSSGRRAGPRSASSFAVYTGPIDGLPVVPGHVHAVRVVPEVGEIEPEPAARREPDERTHGADVVGSAVRRESHHLVLVAVSREPEVLGDRQIQETERVREVDALQHVEPVAAPDCERRAHEVPEAVDGADRGLRERGDEERARQVGRMMLDRVDPGAQRGRIDAEAARDHLPHTAHAAGVPHPVPGEPQARPRPQREERLAREIRPRVPGDRDVVDLGRRDPGHVETAPDRLGRESRPVLDAAEPLLLDRRHELPVPQQHGGGVSVVGVDAEDDHPRGPRCGLRTALGSPGPSARAGRAPPTRSPTAPSRAAPAPSPRR